MTFLGLLQLSGFLSHATLTVSLNKFKAARAVILLRRLDLAEIGRARVVVRLACADFIFLLLALVATISELVWPQDVQDGSLPQQELQHLRNKMDDRVNIVDRGRHEVCILDHLVLIKAVITLKLVRQPLEQRHRLIF